MDIKLYQKKDGKMELLERPVIKPEFIQSEAEHLLTRPINILYWEVIDDSDESSYLDWANDFGDEIHIENFKYYNYLTNEKGQLVPIIYPSFERRDLQSGAILEEEHITDWVKCYYIERVNIEGIEYDKWQKVEDKDDYQWDTSGKKFLYTEVIVEKISPETLKEVFEWPSRSVYTTIVNLTTGEDISGEVIGTGSISVNGSSALRRTVSGLTLQTSEGALAQNYNWVMTDEIRIYQGISNEKTNDEVWYFNLGTYCLSSFSAAESLQGTKISISGKDRMVLLNGEKGGVFTTDVELHQREDNQGNIELIPIEDIISYMLIELGGLSKDEILIDLGDNPTGQELLEYRGTDPLYIFGHTENSKDIIDNFTVYGDQEVRTESGIQEVSELPWGWQETNENGQISGSYIRKIDNVGIIDSNGYAARVMTGEVAGYKIVPLTYPGELKATAGGTIVSILDKIVNTLGKQHEYFFDVDGMFHFQKKNALLSITRGEADSKYTFRHAETDNTNPIYTFETKSLLTSLNRQPKIENIKNDFTIWGTRPSSGKEGIPVHARYIIDSPFEYYANGQKQATEDPDTICEALLAMANSRESDGSYSLIPPGKEYYKFLLPDIKYYWRQIYNPDDTGSYISTDASIAASSPMAPKYWYGNKIDDKYKNDYDNIYRNTKVQDKDGNDIYTTLTDLINVSGYEDIYEYTNEGYVSLYNRTGYENKPCIYLLGEDNIVTFYDWFSDMIEPNDIGEEGQINFAKSFYYRKNGNSIERPLYEQISIAYAKPAYDGQKWDNIVYMLCYLEQGSTELKLVTSVNNQFPSSQIELSKILTETITRAELEDGTKLSTAEGNKISGQFVLFQPVAEAWPQQSTNQFVYKNYPNLTFYKKVIEDEVDKYKSWLAFTGISKNYWRTVTKYDNELATLVSVPLLDTVSYKKSSLYIKNSDNTYSVLTYQYGTNEDKSNDIYIYPENYSDEKIEIKEGDILTFKYLPCDWAGLVKTGGVTTTTKRHPVFAKNYEFNAATHKKLTYEQDPSLLPFKLVWFVPEQEDALSDYLVSTLGNRPLVKSDKGVTAVEYFNVPPMYFTTEANDDENIFINEAQEKLFSVSSRGASADEYVQQLIFENAYCTETASTSIIPIYYLEPNNYIDITDKNEKGEEETFHFILSQFSIPLSYNGTMSLTLTRDKLARPNNTTPEV